MPNRFVPGTGNLLNGNSQGTGDNASIYEAQIGAMVKKGYIIDQAINFLKLATGQTRTAERGSDFNGYPNSRSVTTTRRG